ncbi:MAG: glycosyltransferase, partial [Moorella sp. (in: Bacteria)]|nr:glycosyltransferase [Moorella sp. (in: firmicutes)]
CHLLLVGTGELKNYLEEKVKREHIPLVHFLGFRRDVPEILRESDIVTLTSKHEGLPRCVMEAMAAGKPVVATNVRGNRDLVEDGRTGFLVELGDVPGLVVALERLARNPELRASMGAAGREKIRDYSLDRVLTEMAAIYGRYLE